MSDDQKIPSGSLAERKDFLAAPCLLCSYNGPNYWATGTHAVGCPWHDIGGREERFQRVPFVITAHIAEADARIEQLERKLADWNQLFLAATMGSLPDEFRKAAHVPALWPNEWHQDCAATAFFLKGQMDQREAAETALAGAIERCAKVETALRAVKNEIAIYAEWTCTPTYAYRDDCVRPSVRNALRTIDEALQSERPAADGSETSDQQKG